MMNEERDFRVEGDGSEMDELMKNKRIGKVETPKANERRGCRV